MAILNWITSLKINLKFLSPHITIVKFPDTPIQLVFVCDIDNWLITSFQRGLKKNLVYTWSSREVSIELIMFTSYLQKMISSPYLLQWFLFKDVSSFRIWFLKNKSETFKCELENKANATTTAFLCFLFVRFACLLGIAN